MYIYINIYIYICATHQQPRQGLRPALEDLLEAATLMLTHARCRGKALPTRDLMFGNQGAPRIFLG